MEASSKDSRTLMRDTKDAIRQAVLDAYGGACSCCSAKDPKTLVLVYSDIEQVVAIEHRTPKEGTLEYLWLYNHHYPQNGRKLACRRCMRYADRQHFPDKCNANHDLDSLLPRYAEDTPNEDLVQQVRQRLRAANEPLPARPFEDFWRLPKEYLTRAESLFLLTYKQEWSKLYRRNRLRITMTAPSLPEKAYPSVVELEAAEIEAAEIEASRTDTADEIEDWMFRQNGNSPDPTLVERTQFLTDEELEEFSRTSPDMEILRQMAAEQETAEQETVEQEHTDQNGQVHEE